MSQDKKESVLTRMKQYEHVFTGQCIDVTKPFVIRLDGTGFSKFTRGLQKPYDYNFSTVFFNTAKNLMKEYGANLAYTHSDEISLLFYPTMNKKGELKEPMFGGKLQKMVSKSSAFCTMIFNNELIQSFKYIQKEYDEKTWKRMMSSTAYFDSRIFQMPDDHEMFSYIFSRSQVDCKRNHVFELSRKYYSIAELNKKSTGERIHMLSEKGIDWDKEPLCFRRGTFFKRVIYKDTIRGICEQVDIELTKFNDKINELLKSKVLVV
jgi:tRNA(His) guanylyltransferase